MLRVPLLRNLADTKEAIASFDEVLNSDPNNVDALLMKARIRLHEGNYSESAKYYEQALAQNPKDTMILTELRQIFSNYTYEYSKAIEIDLKLVQMNPDNKNQMMLAEDYIKMGKYANGRKLAIQIMKEVPENRIRRHSILKLLILSSYLLEGNSNKGNEYLTEFINYYKEQENFVIPEEEWNFNGLIKAKDTSKLSKNTKSLLSDTIELLKGSNKDKLFASIAANSVDDLQIAHRKIIKKTKQKFTIFLAAGVIALSVFQL